MGTNTFIGKSKNTHLLVYMDNIFYKDESTLKIQNMENSVSDMKVGKRTNTINVKKFEETTKFGRWCNLIRHVVLFSLFFICTVAVGFISIRPVKPKEDWTTNETFNCITKDLLFVCLFTNTVALLYKTFRLTGINLKITNSLVSCCVTFVAFVVGFICLLISDYLVAKPHVVVASDRMFGISISLAILFSVRLTLLIFSTFDDEDKIRRKNIKINKPRMKKEISLLEVV